MNTLIASSMAISLMASLITTLLLGYLYIRDRETHLAFWGLGSFVALLRHLTIIWTFATGIATGPALIDQLVGLASAMLFSHGVITFMRVPAPRPALIAPVPVAALSTIILVAGLPTPLGTLPIVLFTALMYVGIGMRLLTSEADMGIGVTVVSLSAILMGVQYIVGPYVLVSTSLVSFAFSIPAFLGLMLVMGVLLLHLDRKAIEARDNEVKYRGVIEQSGDGIVLLDSRGVVVEWNSALERITGLERVEALGKNLWEIQPHFHPDEAGSSGGIGRMEDVIREYTATNRATWRHKPAEMKIRRQGGETRIVQILPFPLVLDKEHFTGGILRDVTEQREAELQVRYERDFAQNLLDTAPIMVLVLDTEGRIMAINRFAETIIGCSAHEVQGMDLLTLLFPEEEKREQLRPLLLAALDGMMPQGFPLAINTLHGDERQIEWHHNTVKDAQDKTMGLLVFGYDVTEREKLQEQLLQAQKMETLGRLAGGIAHDFNNVLTAITGYAGFIKEDAEPGSTLQADIEEILKASDRATKLTRQMLAFSRRQVLETKIVDLNELLADLGKMLPRVLREDVELEMHLEPGLGLVQADPGQIEQVVINLAVNARDAMPEGGTLTIETANVTLDRSQEKPRMEPSRQYVMLRLRDTGVGLSEEAKAHLFEPFFTTKGNHESTNLDMAAVYGIVKQHRGDIEVESQLGQGTTFTLYFPRMASDIREPLAGEDISQLPHGSERVLLVEDEQQVRQVASRLLRQLGYEVLIAEDGEEACRLVQAEKPQIDILLTDVIMPRMSGKELAERLRELYPDLKVLFTSGYTGNIIARDGVLEPGLILLPKPFSIENMAYKLREALESPMPEVDNQNKEG